MPWLWIPVCTPFPQKTKEQDQHTHWLNNSKLKMSSWMWGDSSVSQVLTIQTQPKFQIQHPSNPSNREIRDWAGEGVPEGHWQLVLLIQETSGSSQRLCLKNTRWQKTPNISLGSQDANTCVLSLSFSLWNPCSLITEVKYALIQKPYT